MAKPGHPGIPSALRIQRYSGQTDAQAHMVPPSVDHALAGAGAPLELRAAARHGQRRFGHDFSKVRVHTGAAAEQSTQVLHALAYTLGQNIVFGADRYAPGSSHGRRLIAHELTHVVQQSAADGFGGGSSNEKSGTGPHFGGNDTKNSGRFSLFQTTASSVSNGVGLAALHGKMGNMAIRRAPMSEDQRAKAAPQEKHYTLGLVIPHQFQHRAETLSFPNQTEVEAIKVLYLFRQKLLDIIDSHKLMHRMLRDNREEHKIVGFWADTFGGVKLPDYSMWDTPQGTLFEARLLLDGVAAKQDTTSAQKFYVKQMFEGTWRGRFDMAASRLEQVATFLQVAARIERRMYRSSH